MELLIHPYLHNCNNILGQSGTIGFDNEYFMQKRNIKYKSQKILWLVSGQNEIELIAKNLQQSDNIIRVRFHALHNYIKSFKISNYVKSFFFNST